MTPSITGVLAGTKSIYFLNYLTAHYCGSIYRTRLAEASNPGFGKNFRKGRTNTPRP
ncbi:MAG: hypothetical protein HoeaKO_32950 [Hoeflea alexandrii]